MTLTEIGKHVTSSNNNNNNNIYIIIIVVKSQWRSPSVVALIPEDTTNQTESQQLKSSFRFWVRGENRSTYIAHQLLPLRSH